MKDRVRNQDEERLRRCDIHYLTPGLRIMPFCSFNVIPEWYRDKIQQKVRPAHRGNGGQERQEARGRALPRHPEARHTTLAADARSANRARKSTPSGSQGPLERGLAREQPRPILSRSRRSGCCGGTPRSSESDDTPGSHRERSPRADGRPSPAARPCIRVPGLAAQAH